MTGALATFSGVSSTAFSVELSPPTVSGRSDTGAVANITTGSVLVTPSGGLSPYGYSWARIEPDAYTWTIGAAAAATTDFTAQNIPPGVSAAAGFEVTVTDAAGNVAKATVGATVFNGTVREPGNSFDDRHSLL